MKYIYLMLVMMCICLSGYSDDSKDLYNDCAHSDMQVESGCYFFKNKNYKVAHMQYIKYLIDPSSKKNPADYINALIGKACCEYYIIPNSEEQFKLNIQSILIAINILSNEDFELWYKVLAHTPFKETFMKYSREMKPELISELEKNCINCTMLDSSFNQYEEGN